MLFYLHLVVLDLLFLGRAFGRTFDKEIILVLFDWTGLVRDVYFFRMLHQDWLLESGWVWVGYSSWPLLGLVCLRGVLGVVLSQKLLNFVRDICALFPFLGRVSGDLALGPASISFIY